MTIAFVCNDTTGGVRPYLALAVSASAAGHRVRVIAPRDFGPLVTSQGLEFAPLSGSREEIVRKGSSAAEQGSFAAMRLMLTELPKQIAIWTDETLEGAQGAKLLIGGIGGMVAGIPVAERLAVPFLQAHLQPIGLGSNDYLAPLWAQLPIWKGSLGSRLSHIASDAALWVQFAGAGRMARRHLQIRRGPQLVRLPRLFGFSERVVPFKSTGDQIVTGYWFLQEPAWEPPHALEAFITSSTKPVVSIGFGSMTTLDARALGNLVIEAARRSGVRLVLLSGWAGLTSEGNSDVFAADAVPHDWLFPRMSAIVHHGGAGTTGAAFAAGKPQVIVPFGVDQPFWASRVRASGVGSSIPRKSLTAANLSSALLEVLNNPAFAEAAHELSAQIVAEDGVGKAVDNISRVVERLAR